MTNRITLGCWAPIGAGKSTVAKHLVERHGFVRVPFASFKPYVAELFAFSDEQVYGDAAAKETPDPRGADPFYWAGVHKRMGKMFPAIRALFDGAPTTIPSAVIEAKLLDVLEELRCLGAKFTPRAAMQLFGGEFGRALWDGVWVYAFGREADRHARVIADDVRHFNEADIIHERGGKVVWIERPGTAAGATGHSSEKTFDDASPHLDGLLNNNGSLAELEAQADLLVAELTSHVGARPSRPLLAVA